MNNTKKEQVRKVKKEKEIGKERKRWREERSVNRRHYMQQYMIHTLKNRSKFVTNKVTICCQGTVHFLSTITRNNTLCFVLCSCGVSVRERERADKPPLFAISHKSCSLPANHRLFMKLL